MIESESCIHLAWDFVLGGSNGLNKHVESTTPPYFLSLKSSTPFEKNHRVRTDLERMLLYLVYHLPLVVETFCILEERVPWEGVDFMWLHARCTLMVSSSSHMG